MCPVLKSAYQDYLELKSLGLSKTQAIRNIGTYTHPTVLARLKAHVQGKEGSAKTLPKV